MILLTGLVCISAACIHMTVQGMTVSLERLTVAVFACKSWIWYLQLHQIYYMDFSSFSQDVQTGADISFLHKNDYPKQWMLICLCWWFFFSWIFFSSQLAAAQSRGIWTDFYLHSQNLFSLLKPYQESSLRIAEELVMWSLRALSWVGHFVTDHIRDLLKKRVCGCFFPHRMLAAQKGICCQCSCSSES